MPSHANGPDQRETPIPEFNAVTGLEVGAPAFVGALVGSLLGPAGTYAGMMLGSFLGARNAWSSGVKRAGK